MPVSKISVLAILILAAGCSSSSGGSGTPTDSDSGAASAATFTKVYADIISPICVQCHNPSGVGVTSGHLDMSTKTLALTNLVGVAAMGTECVGMGTRVVAGHADMSVLYHKVTMPTCGGQMPLQEAPLSSDQTTDIESWINAGAMDD